MATAAIIPAETVTLIAEALSAADRELGWYAKNYNVDSVNEALFRVRAAKVALQMITDGQ